MKVFLLKNENNNDTYKSTLSSSYTPIFLPLITHTLYTTKLAKFLEKLTHEIIIITSQRSVECLEASLAVVPLEIQTKIKNTVVYTIGPATSRYLANLGFNNIRGSDTGNGHELSKLIILELTKEKIIYLTGEIRKDIIPLNLTNAGLNWEEISTYKTITNDTSSEAYKTNLQLLADGETGKTGDWVVFFSSQGVEHLIDHVKDFKKAVIGPTTNEWLLQRLVQVDIVCDKPSDESLNRQLLEYDHLNI